MSRAEDRQVLLDRLRAVVHSDPRIEGAWLAGSFGRGESDEWSDLDVWIVTADKAIEEIAASRREQATKLGQPVLFVESRFNSPPGGVYLMSGYDCPDGLQLVDWYFQPVGAARMPETNLWIKPNAGLICGDKPDIPSLAVWESPPEEDAGNAAQLAWAMIAIQAKHVARRPLEAGLEFQEFIENLIFHGRGRLGEQVRFPNAEGLWGADARLDRLDALAGLLEEQVPSQSRPAGSVRRMLKVVRAETITRLSD